MSKNQPPNLKDSLPNFQSMAESVKTIKRSVPETADGSYTYFADNCKLAAGIADNIDQQTRDALTSLPGSLNELEVVVEPILSQIEKIDRAEGCASVKKISGPELLLFLLKIVRMVK